MLSALKKTQRTSDGALSEMSIWHFITGEYPPQPGGVSDYTRLIAEALALKGDDVHVWCPSTESESGSRAQLHVHGSFRRFSFADLRSVDSLLQAFLGKRRLFVQWVPHAYGYRSLNVPFCLWVLKRSLIDKDRVDLMVHEPFLPFRGSIKMKIAALVHRLMISILLLSSNQVWMSIPKWEPRLRPYTFRRNTRFRWLPISSNLPANIDSAAINAARGQFAGSGQLIGHFGTYGQPILESLVAIVALLCQQDPGLHVLLLGRGSNEARDAILQRTGTDEARIHATGGIEPEAVAAYLGACDVLIQPYPDGVSSRRTSLMAGLALGRPIVTTEGELTEPFWNSSKAVSLVKVNDAAAFAGAVERLLADSTERERLGRDAKSLYEHTFDVSVTVDSLRKDRAHR